MRHRVPLAIAAALLISACSSPAAPGGSPSVTATATESASAAVGAPSAATADPQIVLSSALTKIASLPGAHFDIKVIGPFDGGGLGSPGDLSDIKVSGEFDPTHRSAVLNLDMALMGGRLTEDYIIIGDVEYSRSNLGGNQWTRQAANGAMGLAVNLSGDIAGAQTLDAAISGGRVVLTVGPDTIRDGVTAFDLLAVVKMPNMDTTEPFLKSLGGSKVGGKPFAWPSGGGTFDVPVHFYFAKDDFRPLGFETVLKFAGNDLLVTGTVTDAGKPSSIKAPPAKDVIDAVNPLDPYGQ
jgi:hypothetical protein